MDWKIRNIRLQELREIYQEKLKNIAYRVYESHFQNGIVKQDVARKFGRHFFR